MKFDAILVILETIKENYPKASVASNRAGFSTPSILSLSMRLRKFIEARMASIAAKCGRKTFRDNGQGGQREPRAVMVRVYGWNAGTIAGR